MLNFLLRFAEMIERLPQEAHLDQFDRIWDLTPRRKSVPLEPLKNHGPCNLPSLRLRALGKG